MVEFCILYRTVISILAKTTLTNINIVLQPERDASFVVTILVFSTAHDIHRHIKSVELCKVASFTLST